MSDNEAEKPFAVERAKTGRAKCKKCKSQIDRDDIRIAKLMSNPFGEGKIKAWHHIDCLFEVFAKQRATTKRIDDPNEDIDGWDKLADDDKKIILDKLDEFDNNAPYKKKRQASPKKDEPPQKKMKQTPTKNSQKLNDKKLKIKSDEIKLTNRDETFREFRRLCADIANASAYTEKTIIVQKLLQKGTDGSGFKGDKILWCKMLLPMADKRIYNLQSKQLIKLFSRILNHNEDSMLEDLEKGDVAETICNFFETSPIIKSSTKSQLKLQEVDEFLEKLASMTREEEQRAHFKSIINKCTPNDLKMIIRLIKHDLRINCGPKHILEAIDSDAYRAYQVSNNLEAVVKKFTIHDDNTQASTSGVNTNSKVAMTLMTPVLPMLAEACTSIEMAMKKCPNGMLAEIKYDGERVQVHKRGKEFRYFSRSLKPVLPHKVNHFRDYIPKAFPDGDDLILDSEILLIDTKTGQPLPFGTLGVHKKAQFKDASVCLFIFDCMYYNGDILMNKTMKERRRILKERMTIIPNHVMISEVEEVDDPNGLAEMIAKVLKMGLEGLVLKDVNSTYEPGKRHWLKVKKDYLFSGAMADSADLVVLGAWYGTGNKGGIMSIFLMGCYDDKRDKWVTVTKVHSGHDDATLSSLQDQLDMIKISKDQNLVPNWLIVNKPMVPDFVARDPKEQPVWEITGAEFTNQGVHTADSISIRFPRVTRIRDDKDWSTATTLDELKNLFRKSSDSIDFSLLLKNKDNTSVAKNKNIKKLDDYYVKKIHNDTGSGEMVKREINSEIEMKECDANKDNTEETKLNKNISNVMKNKKKLNDNKYQEKDDDAVFYAFIDKDYIEYNSEGSPLNWIEGRKPKKGLPENAKPLSKRCESEVKSKGILNGVCAVLSNDIPSKQRMNLLRSLKTMGAEVLRRTILSQARITHVIHNQMEINEEELREYNAPLARRVNKSWVQCCATASCHLDESIHAVTLVAIPCNCKCTYR